MDCFQVADFTEAVLTMAYSTRCSLEFVPFPWMLRHFAKFGNAMPFNVIQWRQLEVDLQPPLS